MWHIAYQVLVFVLSVLGTTGAAHGQKRVALVVGNSGYQHTVKLANPRNDAADISAVLKHVGVQVIEAFDLDKTALDKKVREFGLALRGSSAGIFFYAGHGLQVRGQNYLVPIDARLTTPSTLDLEMLRLDLVQRMMERETNTNILFLDACRDNPLARNLARAMGTRSTEVGRGLAPVESGIGTLISFSTQPGNVALDGTGRNSPFTASLLRHIQRSSEDLGAMLIAVRNDVIKETERRQVPWEHSSLTDRFYFVPAKADSTPVSRPFVGSPGAIVSDLFTHEDLQRISSLATRKRLPLPQFDIFRPSNEVLSPMRDFIGVWVSDRGYEGSNRQYAIIITDVSTDGTAVAYHAIGPPQPESPSRAPAAYFPIIGNISGKKLTVRTKQNVLVAALTVQNRLTITETWPDGRTATVSVKPAWQLTAAERAVKR